MMYEIALLLFIFTVIFIIFAAITRKRAFFVVLAIMALAGAWGSIFFEGYIESNGDVVIESSEEIASAETVNDVLRQGWYYEKDENNRLTKRTIEDEDIELYYDETADTLLLEVRYKHIGPFKTDRHHVLVVPGAALDGTVVIDKN